MTSVQIRSVCRRDLEMTSHSGCLAPGSLLLGVMTHIQDMLQADTQSIEAANSIVRIISTRCRKISLELLSARLLIKYALSYSNISERCDTTDQLQIKDLDQGRTHQHVRKKSRKVRRYMLKSSPLLSHGNTMIQSSNGLHHCPFS